MRVEVTIDEVILRGVPRDQADAVVAALVRHLRHGQVTQTHRPRKPAAGAEALGARAANEIWRAVRGGGAR